MRRVIEMEQQWERFLFVKLLVKNARDVEDLCLHRNERVEEEVWVASEQISDVGVWPVWWVQFDEVDLSQEKISPILQHQLGVVVKHANNFLCTDLMHNLEVVKEPNQVWNLRSQNAVWVFALNKRLQRLRSTYQVDDPFLRELILTELG